MTNAEVRIRELERKVNTLQQLVRELSQKVMAAQQGVRAIDGQQAQTPPTGGFPVLQFTTSGTLASGGSQTISGIVVHNSFTADIPGSTKIFALKDGNNNWQVISQDCP